MTNTIRQYHDKDFDEVLALCQNTYKFDSITKELLHEKIYDDPFYNPEIIWVAEEGAAIVGFLMGTCRMDIRGVNYGYVKLMAVSETHQRKGIARKMYELLENELRLRKVDVMRLGDVPMNYFMPGIDPRYTPALCFAMRMGFNRFMDTSNLVVNLSDREWSDEKKISTLKSDDIEICRATIENKDELMDFVAEEWKLWQFELAMAYKSDPIAIHVAKLKGKIKAFSAHSANNKGLPWFGPMGTHPDLRGKGIGKVLLYRCLEDLKNLGYKTAIIPWVGPIDFYSHHAGAVVERVFWRYEKKLS
ncbi:GNAT family N-acetyltransferase [Labilibaculum sp. DW002]|uniref:GNAT family N-acetyltransferase n=1 Tax=Paralabilibaculum antarcticum TaxID=2912572 RepID=A0ABT5VYB2_9BACT|nr:GNAT family N-acetyltransferase [Labilibaculum sp. DW002]MDE5420399.1 GNAT family N-acetyltransferase [Labilibaculum sp. DW002]